MNIQSNAQESSDAFEYYRQRLRWLLDMHGLAAGSPGCLLGFVQRLSADRNVGMDFWALTRSFRHIETDQISDDRVIRTVVGCVGGPTVNFADEETNAVIEEFAGMLAAMHGPMDGAGDGGLRSTRPDRGEGGAVSACPEVTVGSGEEMPAALEDAFRGAGVTAIPAWPGPSALSHEPSALSHEPSALSHQPSALSHQPSALSHQLDEMLSRLELSSLELKLHLNDLDSRMSRIEPHLEDITALVASSVGSSAGLPVASLVVSPVEHLVATPVESSGEHKPGSGTGLNWRVFWAAGMAGVRPYWGWVNPRRMSVVAAVVVGVLGVVVFLYGSFGRGVGAGKSSPGDGRGVKGTGKAASSSHAIGSAAVTTGVSSVGPGPVVGNGLSKPAARTTDSKKAGSVATHATGSARAMGGRDRDLVAAPTLKWIGGSAAVTPGNDGSNEVIGGQKLAADAVRSGPDSQAVAESDASVGASEPISVAADVMASNLISSQQPSYPGIARLARLEGAVVLQAVISKDGTVDRVQVLNGHHLLRRAASKAVLSWRYKPYLLNGRAVEVATTITVKFLDDPNKTE